MPPFPDPDEQAAHETRFEPPLATLDDLTALNERGAELSRAQENLLRLTRAYHQARAKPHGSEIVEVVDGEHAVDIRVGQLHLQARRQVCCLYLPGRDPITVERAAKESLRAGTQWRCVYEQSEVDLARALPRIEALAEAGQQTRVLPGVPLELYLADGRTAILPTRADPGGPCERALVVHDSALLQAMYALFEGVWSRAVPLALTTTQARTTARPGVRAPDDRLIGLLLSGLTDEAIAHHLGVSYRTVQRRMAELMNRLGAQNRFQAGIVAASEAEARP